MSVAQKAPRTSTGRRSRSQGAAPSRLTEERGTLRTRDDGSIRVVVVADTHSQPHPASLQHIRALGPDAILHGGDIGDLQVLTELREIAPVIAVRGNIDVHEGNLPDVVTIDVEGPERTVLRILLLHIAVYGPKLRSEVWRLATDKGASIVVCGHSHVPFIGRDKGMLVLNAGSIGPRRFALPIVFAVMELSAKGLSLRHVDCETGERWEPPG